MTISEEKDSTKLTAGIAAISQRKAAIVAGVGYLMSFIGAIFASTATAAETITTSEVLFRAGIFGFIIAILGDMVRAWALYVFFKGVNRSLALLSAWFMLVHDAIFGAALINLLFGSALIGGADLLTLFGPTQLQALGAMFLDGFNYGFQIGLFFFSFHLAIVGYLAYKSGTVPKILGVLLIIAGCGYLITSSGTILTPNFPEIIEMILIAPNFIGELAIVVWLVIKGGKRQAEE